ncbi:uncharacterized protein MELLADRAFT_101427 [Melampsora larici-populina 98AG31]|uniref:Uncharacterized protein n=1 Tax=Melampsora larici-populina (strain 98AG31 / pathotype 3-4-7) TaxID=747676 RepID=F4R4Q1_MELLP|nr:uncharacterized protein MELLADRAFT_101427 [Melampsora larici-populina 98AG31]EGG12960.1 hypothetical protein MELLADRAFT_101427 [Melampsora larici-populina 98AG31]
MVDGSSSSKLSASEEKPPPAPQNTEQTSPPKEQAHDSPYSDPSKPSAISFPPAACISPQESRFAMRECGNPLAFSQNQQDRNRTSKKNPLRSSSVVVPEPQSQQDTKDEVLNVSSVASSVDTPPAHLVFPQQIESAGDQEPQSSVDHHIIEVELDARRSSSTLDLYDEFPSTPTKEENAYPISISPSTPSQAHLNTVQKRTYSLSNFDHPGHDSNNLLPQYENISGSREFNPNNRISLKKDTSYLGRLEPDYRPPSTIGRKGDFKNSPRSELKSFSNPPPAYFTG